MQHAHRSLRLTLILILATLAACGSNEARTNRQPTAVSSQVRDPERIVAVTGEVRPARWAELGFAVGGTAKQIYVDEGQAVTAGQPLVELAAPSLERAVAEAQAQVDQAEAELARIQAGPHPQDVAAARQAVAAARANVQVAETQVTAAESAQAAAQTGVAIARARVAIARAGVEVAQAELRRAQAGASAKDLTAAQVAVERAQAAVRQAQAAHDAAGRASDTPQALDLEQATLDLELAQAEYDRLAKGVPASELAPLQANVEAARDQVGLAQAQVSQAQAQVDQAGVAVDQAEAAAEAARAGVDQAEAELDRIEAGATAAEVAVAEATVEQARQALLTAQALLDQTVLYAPFDGTVTLIQLRPAEQVLPGQPVLLLGDLSTLRIETTDLDEIDVARVELEQVAELSFETFPERTYTGRVAWIAPMATPGQAAVSFKVVIEIEEPVPFLRWGMTVFVDIPLE